MRMVTHRAPCNLSYLRHTIMAGKTYSADEIAAKLSSFPGWSLGDDGQLHREFTFKNFAQAMLFANAVGHLADTADHHPDILIHGYKHVTLSLMSHDVAAITDRDWGLVAQIESLPRRE
jgi:4a-hydroxytetrahydrobiopterin dehydratase